MGLDPKVSKNTKKASKLSNDYFKKIHSEAPVKEVEPLTEDQLKKLFTTEANKLTGGFTYTDENTPIIETLFYYFTKSDKFYQSKIIINEKSLNKGILLIGNTGSGKTTILDIFKSLKWQGFRKFSTYDMVESFEKEGEKGITTYFTGNIYFDDLGAEQEAYYYGKREVVGTRLLEKRYNLYLRTGNKTHATSNLTPKQLTDKYGFRIEGRILEMFNIIYLGKNANSIDFRIKNHK